MGGSQFIGEIRMVGFNFAPQGWAKCDGQLLQINQNQALFSLLGTIYGGNGTTTFGLPDLRGRVPMHAGSGPGLTPRSIGQRGGSETVNLTVNQLPSHNHAAVIHTNESEGDSALPSGNFLAKSGTGGYTSVFPDSQLADSAVTVANAGGDQAHDTLQPYQAVNFIIALVGLFPSQ